MGVVYKLTNTVNGKVYVGKTMIGLKQRWSQHRANAKRGIQAYLYRAMRKYGETSFRVDVLAFASIEKELATLEIFWIAQLQSASTAKGYNCTIGGDGRLHTESSRARMKGVRKMSPESRAKLSAALRGKRRTPEIAAKCGVWRGKKVPREIVEKRTAAIRDVWTPEKRTAWSLRMRSRWTHEKRVAWSAKMRAAWPPEKCAAVRKESHILMSPAAREKCRNASKTWWDTHPEAKEKISKRVWSEASKAKARAAAIKGWALRRGAVAISEKAAGV